MRDGTVFTGCNVENASYSLSLCAERVALYTAVSHGGKKGDFLVLAVAGRMVDGDWQFCSPCGACRQVLAEFSSPQNPLSIIYLDSEGAMKKRTIQDLLPDGFSSIL
jgi:cytidine deaminase